MRCRDPYGYALDLLARGGRAPTTAASSDLLRLRAGAEQAVAASIALDPTFALGHATLALLGHELCAAVDIEARLRDALDCTRRARPSASAATCTRSPRTCAATPRPLIRHLETYPRDARAALDRGADDRVRRRHRGARRRRGRSSSGRSRRTATTGGSPACSPSSARSRAASTRRWTSPAARSPRSPAPATPRTPGRTRTTRPATTTPAWPGWTTGSPATAPRSTASATSPGTPRCTSCRSATSTPSAAATTPSCGPSTALGCRALVDTGSLLFRWALTPDAHRRARHARRVADVAGRDALRAPGDAVPRACTPPSRCSRSDDAAALERPRAPGPRATTHPTHREVVAPLARRAAPAWPPAAARPAADAARRAARRRPGGSAAPTPSARSSRRPGSPRCCGPAGSTRPGVLLDDAARPPASRRATGRWRTAALPTG